MRYKRFEVEKYKAVKESPIKIGEQPIPIIGLNESGKTSILEGIFRFDYRNDSLASEKNLQFINRYYPSEGEFSVKAEIVKEQGIIDELLQTFTPEEKTQLEGIIPAGDLEVRRHFRRSSPAVYPYSINGDESEPVQRFCQALILKLPRILFFDNFLESSFPDQVTIPDGIAADPNIALNEHQDILRNMFSDVNYSLQAFFQESDPNARKTILLEVSRNANTKVISDWKKMHVGLNELDTDAFANIELIIEQSTSNQYVFDFQVIETFKDIDKVERQTSMPLRDRSLGFRWFFNFSVRKCFGSTEKGTFIYLFDEPGSFLHNSAQEILAKAIKDLASVNPVIFSTHSELLLNPEFININNIKIIEKKDRLINLVPFAESKDKRTLGALTPLYKALRTNVALESTIGKTVVVTEGITDFYFWKMVSDKIIYLPGFGAEQNEYLISIAIGTSKQYIALFDGDEDGNKAIERYKGFFGEEESRYWIKYVNKVGNEIELEDILSKTDQERLTKITGAPDLKKAMTLLFFSSKKNEFWKGINSETTENVKANISNFKKLITISPTDFKYSLAT